VGDCVSVDLAPLVEAHVPFKPEFGWPRSNACWPSGSKIDQIKATGIHTVATDPFYWKLSFVSSGVIDRVAAGDSVNRLASTNFRICGRLTASPTSCLNRLLTFIG
jgi:hypothetical protein